MTTAADYLVSFSWPRSWRAHWIGAEAPAGDVGAEPQFTRRRAGSSPATCIDDSSI